MRKTTTWNIVDLGSADKYQYGIRVNVTICTNNRAEYEKQIRFLSKTVGDGVIQFTDEEGEEHER